MSVAEMSVAEMKNNYARIRREAYAPKAAPKPEPPVTEIKPAEVPTAPASDPVIKCIADAMERRLAEEISSPDPVVKFLADAMERRLEQISAGPRRISFDDVLRETCRYFRMKKWEIMIARRTQSVVRPRQIAMYLSKTLCLQMSFPAIAKKFNMDHTTILSGCRKIQSLIDAQHAETIRAINCISADLGVNHV